jgi:hypothetical protein
VTAINLNGPEARPFLWALKEAGERGDFDRWAGVCLSFADWLAENGRPDLEEAFRAVSRPDSLKSSVGQERFTSMGRATIRPTGTVTTEADAREFGLVLTRIDETTPPVVAVTKRRWTRTTADVS